MKNELILFIILVLITSIHNTYAFPELSDFVISPSTINPDEEINISVTVEDSINPIITALSEIKYPSGDSVNYSMLIVSELQTETGIGGEPYNLTALSYDISIDCHDFTDGSECNVNASYISGSCANVTFDDNSTIGDPGEDMDIGVLLCINETANQYQINFTKWGYDAANDIRAGYCINSSFGVDECSGWVLTNESAVYDETYTKTIYGGYYLRSFSDTSEVGRYDVRIYAENTNNEVNSNETEYFDVYNDNPGITLFEPENQTESNDGFMLFEYNVAAQTSNIINCSLLLNNNIWKTDFSIKTSTNQYFVLSKLTNGEYSWSMNCIENNTNNTQYDSETRTFSVEDTTGPDVYLYMPFNEGNITSHNAQFQYFASDGAYDVHNCSLFLNDILNQTMTSINESEINEFNLTLANGDYNWSVACFDNSPNSNQNSSSTNILSVDVETTPPEINLIFPSNETTDTDGNVELSYNATDLNTASGISSCQLIINDVQNQTSYNVTETSEETFVVEGLNNGEYEWRVDCTDDFDNLGYSEARLFTVNKDLDGPNIGLEAPTTGYTESSNKTIIFSYSVTDNNEIANCSLLIDGQEVQNNYTISTNESNVFSETLEEGAHNWGVSCTDASDNHNEAVSANRTLTIDTKPTVVLDTPDSITDSDGDLLLNFTVNDNVGLKYCELYTNIDSAWEKRLRNSFVQPNYSLSFTLENIADDTVFKWNVMCKDSDDNIAWASSNRTVTIDNTPPSISTIPDLNWDEDSSYELNLSLYFSDADGDSLIYTYDTSENNVSVEINNGIAHLETSKNFFTTGEIVFTASDGIENTSSNTIDFTINEMGDTAPKIVWQTPDYVNKDGYLFLTCNASDDIALINVSLYQKISGIWELNQTQEVSGDEASVIFELTDLTDGSYLWNCQAYDDNLQNSFGQNKTANVSISVDIEHQIPTWMVNDVDTQNYVILSYSKYLNDSLVLGNLTIRESDGELYYEEDMSTATKYDFGDLIVYPELIDIIPSDIFDENFSVGRISGLNISITYSYKGTEYETKADVGIEVVNDTIVEE